MEKFYASLAELLEVDEIDANRTLKDYDNWDSLTVLSLTVMLDKEFGVSMTARDINLYPTAAELFAQAQRQAR
jgi:acyl carrier protein